MTRPSEVTAARAGGWALILAVILFIAVFSYLAATFDYPDILDRPAAQREVIEVVFVGLNSYLGNFIGEFVGELALNLFFLLTAYAMLRSARHARWLGIGGVLASVIGFLAMFRNVTPAMAPIADANNIVLPVWLVVLGIALTRERASE